MMPPRLQRLVHRAHDRRDAIRAPRLVAIERRVPREPLHHEPRIAQQLRDHGMIRQHERREQLRRRALRPLVVREHIHPLLRRCHRLPRRLTRLPRLAHPHDELGRRTLELIHEPLAIELDRDGVDVERAARRNRADMRRPLRGVVRQQRHVDGQLRQRLGPRVRDREPRDERHRVLDHREAQLGRRLDVDPDALGRSHLDATMPPSSSPWLCPSGADT